MDAEKDNRITVSALFAYLRSILALEFRSLVGFCAHAGFFDDGRPFVDFGFQIIGELLRRAADRLSGISGQAVFDVLRLHGADYGLM